jgi:hypothetical protein
MHWARTAAASFAVGFTVAGGFGMLSLRNDLWESHRLLAAQVCLLPSSCW